MSCKTPSRSEITASIWNNDQIPVELCKANPSLWDIGKYRKLNDGKEEFISYCSPEIVRYLSIHENDFINLMDKYVPEDAN